MRQLALWLIGLVLLGSGLTSAVYARTADPYAANAVPQQDASPAALPGDLRAAIVHAPDMAGSAALQAWTQILREEGFPFDVLADAEVAALGGAGLAQRYGAVLVPDEAARALSDGAATALDAYVRLRGGKLLAAYDAATYDAAGKARRFGALSGLVGAEYGRAGVRPVYETWRVPPTSPLRRAFDAGLYTADDTLRIYGYGDLTTRRLPLGQVSAQPLVFNGSGAGNEDALVLEQHYPRGGLAVYADADLAYHKYYHNDDFLLRGLLRHLLIYRSSLPRLVAAPDGVGGLVLDIHVCSGAYIPDLEKIFGQHLFSQDLRFSWHITAGPDNNRPGDGRGFNAEGPRGRNLVRQMARYGSIGSQGGWIHNYFALQGEHLSPEQVRHYIDRNFAALTADSGGPVVEYSAPGGEHSALINDMLASWGVEGVAIPNNFFSPPTHAWWNFHQEDRFWLFGYTGTRFGFCLENMNAAARSPQQIAADMDQVVDTVVATREIRQFYTHPLIIAAQPTLWLAVQQSVLDQVHAGTLTVRTMGDYARFMDRHQLVQWRVQRTAGGYHLSAEAPGSLSEMTFALPTGGRRLAVPGWARVRYAGGWAYVTVLGSRTSIDATLALTGPV